MWLTQILEYNIQITITHTIHFSITHPVATSHIFMVLSLEADTMWSPLGMMATDDTLWSCPEDVKMINDIKGAWKCLVTVRHKQLDFWLEA